MTMADENSEGGGQLGLPGTENKGTDDSADRLAAAEKRARDAEKRARDAEKSQRDREAAEAKQRRDAELKSADDAKRALADAEAREKRATEQLELLRARETERIDGMLKALPETDRARLVKYRDRLGDDFGAFVAEETQRHGGALNGAGDAEGGGDESPANANPPPPANPGGVMRRTKGKGRGIEPWAQAKLDEMGVDTTAARNSLEVEREGRSAKFIFPPQKMRTLMRERSLKPAQLTQKEYDDLHK